ncbi:MAG: hypothetical protein GY943_16390 [Chloroflexi bacterium]|nr:hypothetical protein [Chloroflexota bacterium]
MSDPTRKEKKFVPPSPDKRLPYQKPEIIFEKQISTRAGSPLQSDGGFDQIELIDLLTGRSKP